MRRPSTAMRETERRNLNNSDWIHSLWAMMHFWESHLDLSTLDFCVISIQGPPTKCHRTVIHFYFHADQFEWVRMPMHIAYRISFKYLYAHNSIGPINSYRWILKTKLKSTEASRVRCINAAMKSWLTLAIGAAANGASNETLWRRLNANDIATSAATETNFFGVENSFKILFLSTRTEFGKSQSPSSTADSERQIDVIIAADRQLACCSKITTTCKSLSRRKTKCPHLLESGRCMGV